MGTLDPPGTHPYQTINMSVVDSSEHRQLARLLATESIVMLKNDPPTPTPTPAASSPAPTGLSADDGPVLPLDPAKKVAVIGPNANRTMTLLSNYPGCKTSPGGGIDPACTLVNPLQGIQAYASAHGGGSVTFAQGCEIDGDDVSMIPAAVEAAQDAGIAVIVAGIITCQESGLYV